MFKVSRSIHFCYGHRLLNYDGKCRHLHGHNARVEIELSAMELDGRGMVRDFTEIKREIQGWINEHLDHKMILCRTDPLLNALKELDEPVYVIDVNPTAENLAKLIYEAAQRLNLPVSAVSLWETEQSSATYQPGR